MFAPNWNPLENTICGLWNQSRSDRHCVFSMSFQRERERVSKHDAMSKTFRTRIRPDRITISYNSLFKYLWTCLPLISYMFTFLSNSECFWVYLRLVLRTFVFLTFSYGNFLNKCASASTCIIAPGPQNIGRIVSPYSIGTW